MLLHSATGKPFQQRSRGGDHHGGHQGLPDRRFALIFPRPPLIGAAAVPMTALARVTFQLQRRVRERIVKKAQPHSGREVT